MTALALPLEIQIPVDSTRATDRVTARVLRRTLVPELDAAVVAKELATLAGYRRDPLLGALRRLDRVRTTRQSTVIERGEVLLCAALRLANDSATSPAA